MTKLSSARAHLSVVPKDSVDDAALARMLSEGGELAATLAYDRFSPMVRGLVRRALGPRLDVEDVVQEVFVRVFDTVHRLREQERLRSYVASIAVNVVRSALRRHRVRSFVRLSDTGTPPDTVQQPASQETAHAISRLYGLLDELRPESRLLFTLRYFEEMTVQEIAEHLGVSHATAKRRLARTTEYVMRKAALDPCLRGIVDAPEGEA